MPRHQDESTKTMDPKVRKSSSKKLSAGAAASPARVRFRGRKSHRGGTRSGKGDEQTARGGAPFIFSKVTARSQTTLPSSVRAALGIQPGDRIAYEIAEGQVLLHRVTGEADDPALDGFLDLLQDDIARNKDRVVWATEGFACYLEELTAGIEVDYDAPIEGDFRL